MKKLIITLLTMTMAVLMLAACSTTPKAAQETRMCNYCLQVKPCSKYEVYYPKTGYTESPQWICDKCLPAFKNYYKDSGREVRPAE